MQNNSSRISELNQALKAISVGKHTVLAEEIENGITEAVKRVKNGTVVTVTSAIVFNEAEKNRMERYIGDNFQEKIIVEYHIDPKILGGFRITVGDWYLDGTLLAQIDEIKNLFRVSRNG